MEINLSNDVIKEEVRFCINIMSMCNLNHRESGLNTARRARAVSQAGRKAGSSLRPPHYWRFILHARGNDTATLDL